MTLAEISNLSDRIFSLPQATARGLIDGLLARITPEERQRLEKRVKSLGGKLSF
jgi:hypothetical protein